MYDVFISYSHKDENIRESVCKKLESEGIKCWYAPRDIQPGKEWAEAITAALKQCRVMILIFTENSNSSVQVLREVGLAVDFRKSIIPFQCTDTKPTGSMMYYLSTLHWLNIQDDPQNSLDELAALTKKCLSGDTENLGQTAPVQKKTFSLKMLLSILVPLLVLNALLFLFLLNRGVFDKKTEPDNNNISDQLQELIDQGVVTANGEDIRTLDLENLYRWTVVNNKLYFFENHLDSPNADNYLYALMDDYTIMLEDYNHTGSKEIVIPEIIDGLPVTIIGESCFEDNTEIEKVTFPDTVQVVSRLAFAGCTNLREVIFSDFLVELGTESFAESGLISAVLPDSVKRLEQSAFYGCPQLETVFLPENIQLIPLGIFQNTPRLQYVTIASEKPFIDIDAFDADSGVTLIGHPESYTEIYAKRKGFGFQPITRDESK